jgi:hypothetical protein
MAMIIYSQFSITCNGLPVPHFFRSHILNLSKGASQTEVHERYRTLSLVFHPDKQQDAQAKEVAARNFLEIQKAYQGCFPAFAVLMGVMLTTCEQFCPTLFSGMHDSLDMLLNGALFLNSEVYDQLGMVRVSEILMFDLTFYIQVTRVWP